jgi:hypothetical protein
MLPDDVFRTKLDRTIAALRRWSGALADCARVEEQEASRYWRLAVRPHAIGACPVEMILHHRQRCDLAIGNESYEDRAVEEFDLLLPLAEAIAAGRVLTRHKSSANTGAALAIETHVRLADGRTWQADRRLRPRAVPGRTILEDRWFLPYRR